MIHRFDNTKSSEAWCAEWNASCQVGDSVEYTDDHGKTWEPSTLASRAFVRDGKPVVRIRGARDLVHLKDVVPA
jgi:hypothetical protein